MQEVVLDKSIRLLDSPGIVFADGDTAATALRNCVNVDEIEDVLTPVQAIIDKCPQAYLMQLYSISRFAERDCTAFLALVARSTGRLKKGDTSHLSIRFSNLVTLTLTLTLTYYIVIYVSIQS